MSETLRAKIELMGRIMVVVVVFVLLRRCRSFCGGDHFLTVLFIAR